MSTKEEDEKYYRRLAVAALKRKAEKERQEKEAKTIHIVITVLNVKPK